MPSPITTHVLDTSRGAPAAGVPVVLEQQRAGGGVFDVIGEGTTNTDGRVIDLLPSSHVLTPGVYRLTFETGTYFAANGVIASFYPQVGVSFLVAPFDADESAPHYHVPLLLSPLGTRRIEGVKQSASAMLFPGPEEPVYEAFRQRSKAWWVVTGLPR